MRIDTGVFSNMKVFSDFANEFGRNSSAVAKLAPREEKDPLNDISHQFTVSKVERNLDDKVGRVWRNERKQERNNLVRATYKNAIIKLFGGFDKIPESVKTAMELDNFKSTSGKPLTARRISRINEAIVKVLSKENIVDEKGRAIDKNDVMDGLGIATVNGKPRVSPVRETFINTRNQELLENIEKLELDNLDQEILDKIDTMNPLLDKLFGKKDYFGVVREPAVKSRKDVFTLLGHNSIVKMMRERMENDERIWGLPRLTRSCTIATRSSSAVFPP